MRLGGHVTFRLDWADIAPKELWDAGKETMRSKHSAAASSLIADIEAHSHVFLDEWDYNHVFKITVQQLRDALNAVQSPGNQPNTRLALFQ